MSDTQTAIDEHLTTDGVLKHYDLSPDQRRKAGGGTPEHVPFSLGAPGVSFVRQAPDPYKANLD